MIDWEIPSTGSAEQQPPRWKGRLIWPTLVAVAWIIYEITRQPALAAAVACIKFGWNDLRTARWLRRVDPERGRGRVCFWFYLASGLWKITFTAGVVMVAGVGVQSALEGNHPPPPQQHAQHDVPASLVAMVIIVILGSGFSILASFMGIGLALKFRVKIWLDSRVHRARRENLWPPPYWKTNRAGCVFFPTLVLTVVGMIVALIFAFDGIPGQGGAANPNAGGQHLFGISLVIGALVLMICRDILQRFVLASAPWECWTELADAAEDAPAGPRFVRQ